MTLRLSNFQTVLVRRSPNAWLANITPLSIIRYTRQTMIRSLIAHVNRQRQAILISHLVLVCTTYSYRILAVSKAKVP